MIIRNLQMDHFGKFHETGLNLNPGINIVYGRNESGKSTIHAFIQCMLFGAERLRGRGAGRDIYTKYQPWELSGNYSGRLEFEYQGRTYRIVRNFHKDSETFSVIDVVTGQTYLSDDQEISDLIPSLTPVNYRNSISIGQLGSQPDAQFAGNMQSFLANMSVSASESVDVTKALDYLKDERKKVKSKISMEDYENKEDRLDELKVELAGRDGMIRKKQNLEALRTGTKGELDRLEHKVETFLREDRKERKKAIEMLQENNDVADMYKDKKRQLHELEAQQTPGITKQQMEQAIEDYEKLQRDADNLQSRCDEIDEQSGGGVIRILSLLLPAVALTVIIYMAGGLLGLYGTLRNAVTAILAVLTVFFAIMLVYSNSSGRKRMASMQDEIRSIAADQEKILASCDAGDLAELKKRCSGWQGNQDAVRRLREEMDGLRKRYDALQEPLRPYLEKYGESVSLESVMPDEDRQKMEALRRQQNDYTKQIELLEWQIEQLTAKQNELDTLKEILAQMNQQHNSCYEDLQALDITENVIKELTSQIHGTFGSQLNDYVSQLLAMITDDAHRKLTIDEQFRVLVDNDRIPVQPQQLSAGTADQIYLAVRIAVSQILYAEPMPLILDESFAMYDDERLKKILSWMMQQNAFGQVIIFSCHHREARILQEMGCPYTLCELN